MTHAPTESWNDLPERTLPAFCAASLLEKSGLKACIIGDAVTVYFHSDIALRELHVAIADDQFDSARSMLRSSGFEEIDRPSYYQDIFPVMGECRLLCAPRSISAVITPASVWHLEIDDSTTFLLPGTLHRMPYFLTYLKALIRTIVALEINGDKTLHFAYQLSTMAKLLYERPELATLAPGDRFFIDFYQKQVGQTRVKVARLWEQIERGSMSLELAKELVPRPDLRKRSLKQKWGKASGTGSGKNGGECLGANNKEAKTDNAGAPDTKRDT